MYPVKLPEAERERLLGFLRSKNGTEYQAARIFRLLSENPQTLTGEINARCSVGNISDVVHTAINPKIMNQGYKVDWNRPPEAPLNQFNQPTGEVLWSVFKFSLASNDPEYDSIESEIETLKSEHPEKFGGNSTMENVLTDLETIEPESTPPDESLDTGASLQDRSGSDNES